MTVSTPASQSQTSDLITLASWMAGDFSNQKQAFEFPTQFAHIRIFFRPLPYKFFSGVGLYSEQTYDYDLWRPYRQGVHRLVDRGDHVYIENYGLSDGVPYAGGGHTLEVLKTLTHDCIQPRQGCSMVFRRENDQTFIGSVEPGNGCLIPRQGCMTYLTSHVEVTSNTWVSLDQGRDVNTHEHVWGSTEGTLKFEKWESFAHELPC